MQAKKIFFVKRMLSNLMITIIKKIFFRAYKITKCRNFMKALSKNIMYAAIKQKDLINRTYVKTTKLKLH